MGMVLDADTAIAAPQRAYNTLKACQAPRTYWRFKSLQRSARGLKRALGSGQCRSFDSRLVALETAAIDVDQDP